MCITEWIRAPRLSMGVEYAGDVSPALFPGKCVHVEVERASVNKSRFKHKETR